MSRSWSFRIVLSLASALGAVLVLSGTALGSSATLKAGAGTTPSHLFGNVATVNEPAKLAYTVKLAQGQTAKLEVSTYFHGAYRPLGKPLKGKAGSVTVSSKVGASTYTYEVVVFSGARSIATSKVVKIVWAIPPTKLDVGILGGGQELDLKTGAVTCNNQPSAAGSPCNVEGSANQLTRAVV